jgi:hypothetical protein
VASRPFSRTAGRSHALLTYRLGAGRLRGVLCIVFRTVDVSNELNGTLHAALLPKTPMGRSTWMTTLYRWTAWNLTAGGWFRSPTVESADEAARIRPAETLLALLSMNRTGDAGKSSSHTVLYRSPDVPVLAAAIAKYGATPGE